MAFMVPPRLRLVFGFAIAAFVVIVPLWYCSRIQRDFRNFRVVDDGVLYRSAQLSLPGLSRIVNDYRLKTIVCIRDGKTDNDQAEEAYCKTAGIRFVRLAPRNWGPIDGIVPADKELDRFFDVVDDKTNYPILVHCFAGAHRTGAYVAVYRMEYDGWTNDDAIAELRTCGYKTFDGDLDINEFLRTYRPRHVLRSTPIELPKRLQAMPVGRHETKPE
jgi:protein tyrosine/serine phosphatase